MSYEWKERLFKIYVSEFVGGGMSISIKEVEVIITYMYARLMFRLNNG
jgi:hypothetical protein